jgi:large subunit ribosomal protein L13
MKDIKPSEYVVFDAKDKVLGRLASTVAKELLGGKKVAIINAEQSIISGNKKLIKKKYKTRLDLQEKENPEHSPYWSRRPDFLVKRVVRGMLPYHKKTTGRDAYKRLMVFVGTPEAFKGMKPIEIKTKDPKMLYTGYVRVSELSEMLGYQR